MEPVFELVFWIAVVIFILWLVSRLARPSPDIARPPPDSGLSENATRLADNRSHDENVDEVATSFLSVFAIMSSRDRDRIVRFYMSKHGCGFYEAMKLAIIDRQNDEERYR